MNHILAPVGRTIMEITPHASQEQVVNTLDMIDALKRRIKELEAQAKEAAVEWIEHNGDITLGTIRLYVGTTKTTKCVDNRATLEALLDATNGDLDQLSACLASGAFKHGAARTLLPDDEYAWLFETTEKKNLETGKPTRELQRLDTQFVKEVKTDGK